MNLKIWALVLYLTISYGATNFLQTENEGDFTSKREYSEVIAYREIELLEGVDSNDFEAFVRGRLLPTFEEYVPGVRIKVMQGERGVKNNVYVLLLIFDSINTRNFYFPTDQHGETNMPLEPLKLWRPGQIVLIEEFDRFIKPLEDMPFTDFKVLK